MNLIPVLFGWPAILFSLALSAAGLVWRKPLLLVAGMFVALPFDYYLFGTPRFRFIGPLLPLFQLAVAYLLQRRLVWLAWIFLLPFAAPVALIGWEVLRQS